MTVFSLDSSGYIQGGSKLTTEIDIQRNTVSMTELQDGLTFFNTQTECRNIFVTTLRTKVYQQLYTIF